MTGVFLAAIELFSSIFFVTIRAPTVSRQCFVFCCDNVATETTEAICQGCDRSLVKAKRFRVVTEICSVVT